MTNPSIASLIERGLTGKLNCPSLEPSLSERPLSSKEWRAFGIEAAEALSQLTREVDELREANVAFEAALDFYANPKIYEPHPHGPAFDRRDLSFTARVALSRSSGRVSDATE